MRDPSSIRSQRIFSEAVDKFAFAELRDVLPPFDKARLLSVSGQGAGRVARGVIPSLTLGYVSPLASSQC